MQPNEYEELGKLLDYIDNWKEKAMGSGDDKAAEHRKQSNARIIAEMKGKSNGNNTASNRVSNKPASNPTAEPAARQVPKGADGIYYINFHFRRLIAYYPAGGDKSGGQK